MPQQNGTTNISKSPVNYDAIVIGSGISGGWAAKELCEKGLKVLMIDRGRQLSHGDYPTATKAPWEFDHRINLTQNDFEKHFIQKRHYSLREDNKHFYIDDRENPYTEVKRFDWIRGDIVGGRSLLWARACWRFSDLDFTENLMEGIGVDWPIRYRDIAPWYSYVEKFVGISGNRDGIAHIPDGDFLPPFEMTCVEKDIKKKLEKEYPGRHLIMGRSANLTKPKPGRGQCMARDLCHRGCPYGAYFSSNSSTIPAARATGNLEILPDTFVRKIVYDENKKAASGVETINRITKEEKTFTAKIIFVNASTVASTAILLNSVSNRFPEGLGNDSGQLGKNLMDHHKGISISGKIEGFEDQYYSGRRPVSCNIPRFVNMGGKKEKFIRGYNFGLGTFRAGMRPETTIGAAFKDSMTMPGGWQISMWGFGECLPYEENRIFLSKTSKDPYGMPMVEIDCEFRENEKQMHEHMKTTAAEIMEAFGAKDIKVSGQLSFPGNANHEMGTARMGRDSKTSVLNSFNQMHAVKNVFVTDGSCMPSSSSVNPSITYMALTARACDFAYKELKKGNI